MQLYHGTYQENLKSIMEHGLGRGEGAASYPQSRAGYVYLAESPDAARKWAAYAESRWDEASKKMSPDRRRWEGRYLPSEDVVVLAIDTEFLNPELLEPDENIRIPEECPECGTPVEDRTDTSYSCLGCDFEFEGDTSYQYKGTIPPSALHIWKQASYVTSALHIWKQASYVTIPLGMLNAPFTKVAISIPELVKETNAFSQKHRPGCVPQLIKSDPSQLYLQYNVKCKESYSDPAGHDVRIKFDVSKVYETQKAKDLDVQVTCTCPAFLYWGAQWNLHQRDALLGEPRPLLQAPTERKDLRDNFVLCKHIKAVTERILPSVQHNIVKILREREVLKNKELRPHTNPKLDKKLEEMRERQRKQKEKSKGRKEIEQKLLDALRKREEEEQAKKEESPIVEREGGTTAVPVVETPKKEELPETAVMPKDVGVGVDDISDLLAEEENKLHKQQEEEHRRLKDTPHLHEGLPYETEQEKEEHHHGVPTDHELDDLLKHPDEETPEDDAAAEASQKRLRKMRDDKFNKWKRTRSSLEIAIEASLLDELAEGDDAAS